MIDKMEKDKIVFKGTHPDSLYRVPAGAGEGGGRVARALRLLRWPVALVLICVALGAFLYFLMPDTLDQDTDTSNSTYWDASLAGAHTHHSSTPAPLATSPLPKVTTDKPQQKESRLFNGHGSKTTEIDFYDYNSEKDTTVFEEDVKISSKLPIPPVFPTRITPEVQYGNEKADSGKLRTSKKISSVAPDYTLPHITQKPEKPLAIYFKDGAVISPVTESIHKADTISSSYVTNTPSTSTSRRLETSYRPKEIYFQPSENLPPFEDIYNKPANYNFTSGHSKLFGISIEESKKFNSTTPSPLYQTKVSPTLPVWRDTDRATTKRYPVPNYSEGQPQCRSTRLELCRGVVSYDLTMASATLSDAAVDRLLPQVQYLAATNCSDRVTHFLCALLEPECNMTPNQPRKPCQNLCRAVQDNCEGMIPQELASLFECQRYPSTDCTGARAPCFASESGCRDGSCIPRDWVCDAKRDCPAGEDETPCAICGKDEYRCRSGSCINKQWLCDGYADCGDGEDEAESLCESVRRRRPSPPAAIWPAGVTNQEAADDVTVVNLPAESTAKVAAEPGEEQSGSAPAPSVQKLYKPDYEKTYNSHAIVESDSKEILMTSDSNNAYRRNYTRRPSPSRLLPYSRAIVKDKKPTGVDANDDQPTKQKTEKKIESKPEPTKEGNIGEMSFFDEFEKEAELHAEKSLQERNKPHGKPHNLFKGHNANLPIEDESSTKAATKIDNSKNKFERTLNGAEMLRKAQAALETTDAEPEEEDPTTSQPPRSGFAVTSHSSPCPADELRCVDGRCITLAQLCDGTIDCSDHADEDNCYT